MKAIIAGGREYNFTDEDVRKIDEIHSKHLITEVVSGCARGADKCGEIWAEQNSIKVSKFPADWEKYGKSAGYRRNVEMSKYADALILFHGGKGTEHMFNIAKKENLKIFDFRKDFIN